MADISGEALTVLTIDDHDLIRMGIAAAADQLSPNTRVYGAVSIEEGVAALRAHSDIDLVLLDLTLPDATGLDGLARVLEVNPDVPVIILTADERRESIEDAFQMGASGYIPKSTNMGIVINALRIILAGGRYLPSEILYGVDDTAGRYAMPKAATPPSSRVQTEQDHVLVNHYQLYGLTSRQAKVADLLRKGMSNKEICRELGLSISTVKTHIASILRALRTTSRGKAMALLNEGGAASDDSDNASPLETARRPRI